MRFWERWRKRRAIRRYLADCGELLVARYGLDDHYAPARTLRTLAVGRFNLAYAEHACAMFASQEQFIAWALAEHERERPEPPAAAAGNHPYRDPATATLPTDPPSRRKLLARYAELRREVADDYNDGSYRFLPERIADEQWTPVSNEIATGMKVPFV